MSATVCTCVTVLTAEDGRIVPHVLVTDPDCPAHPRVSEIAPSV